MGVLKNKKFFILILMLIFGIAFFNRAMAACEDKCEDCTDELSCNNSDAYCGWGEDGKCRPCLIETQVAWPDSPMGTKLTGCSSLTLVVKYFYEWGIAIGGIAVFIALLIGGFLFLTSAGDPARLKEAKDRIFSAFTGLALLLGSWLILNTINPDLTVLRPPSFKPPEPVPGISEELFERGTKSCEYAILYDKPAYEGNTIKIPAKEEQKDATDLHEIKEGFYVKSAKLFQMCEKFEKCEDGRLAIFKDGKEQTTFGKCEKGIKSWKCGDKEITNRLLGDANGDCVVDKADFEICRQYYEVEEPIPSCDDEAFNKCNWNDDHVVDPLDLATWGANEGNSCCMKEGGSCSLQFFIWEDPYWEFWVTPHCGARQGETSKSIHNVQLLIPSETEIQCVKLIKTGLDIVKKE